MGYQAKKTGTATYAWSLLKNHAHLLLRSGYSGLPKFRRRFLTGYAFGYNRRHKRFGHLFQNRYKSILCEEDPYFRELVRYIHLNPVRAGLVADLQELETYPWCGHCVVLGRKENDWQDRDYILGWFGEKEKTARQAYRRYVEEGLPLGQRPDLVGGGLIRSQGGWSNVISMRRQEDREMSDERILGSGDFVEQLMDFLFDLHEGLAYNTSLSQMVWLVLRGRREIFRLTRSQPAWERSTKSSSPPPGSQ